ncbi:hypothetical protein [Cellulophaga sp. Z1A5H]|uniref:hypothetical protein n=1 Tax=Cellulophaga sp. Z1A5H TaxID=2687291 RepID=UPI0013FD4026|nr:hypothetical protein [Cellulophaga sp. Z1A5H]
MDHQSNKSNSNILSIVGIVFGISSLIFSVIPCLGVFAIIFGAIAIILSIIAVIRVFMLEQTKILAIIALVISLLGMASLGFQFFVTSKLIYDEIELQQINETEELDELEESEDIEELDVIPEEIEEIEEIEEVQETSFNSKGLKLELGIESDTFVYGSHRCYTS